MDRLLALAALFVATFALAGIAFAADPTVVRIEAAGTAFRVTLSDGSIRQGTDLAGAVLVFSVNGRPLSVRVAAIIPDPNDRTSSVLLHDFRVAGTNIPLCEPDPDGKRMGFPLAGRTNGSGRFEASDPGVFELICTSGAQGKCVRFGYHPWEFTRDGRSLRDFYDACVRMVRADYCGDGHAWTRPGTLIDVGDDLAIQKSDTGSDPTFAFEAGWAPDGAVCVAHTRIPENITLDRLRESCPRLASARRCDEHVARTDGALLFNRSR
jgi:hypothetical protein